MTSKPTLIIPAAGLGSRLKASGPKALYPVRGKPMIDHLFDLHGPFVARFVVVVHPSFEREVRKHCDALVANVLYSVQDQPTGMLDAVLSPLTRPSDVDSSRVWITWCDQIAIHPVTVQTLAHIGEEDPEAALILPTAPQANPYIHIERKSDGRIDRILQRREGDQMPDVGESDMGLFSLSREAYFADLPEFADSAVAGDGTHERNFLPFIPWLTARYRRVRSFACVDPREAIGVNDQDAVRVVEAYLAERDATSVRA